MVTTWERVPTIFYKSNVIYYFKTLSLQQVQFYLVRKKYCTLIQKMSFLLTRYYFKKISKLLQNFTPGNTPTSSNLAILVSYWQMNLLLCFFGFFWVFFGLFLVFFLGVGWGWFLVAFLLVFFFPWSWLCIYIVQLLKDGREVKLYFFDYYFNFIFIYFWPTGFLFDCHFI